VRIDNIARLNVGATMRRREFIKLLGGAATAWPVAAHGQQLIRPRHIGVLMAFNETDVRAKNWLALFDSELAKLGWSGERKPQMDVRWAGDSVDRMQGFAKELVAQRPDVILSFGTPVTAALQRETHTIPIVFAIVSDPVGEGFVASLSRPGGNITGFHNSESSIGGKWMELLKQIAPSVQRAAMIFDPDTAPGHGKYYMPDFEASARSLNVEPIAAPVQSVADLERVITDLGRQPGSGFVAMADFFLFINRETAILQAARHRVPAVYPWRDVVTAGGLLSYGPDLADIVRRAAPYVDRVLHGEKPADLPVQVPTKFEVAVNVKTARALGLDVPASILVSADQVIE
jgi:putative tryptophan/tyrosine transport system substrate-binding protein